MESRSRIPPRTPLFTKLPSRGGDGAMNKSKQRPKRRSGPRWPHHNTTTSAWRSMAFGGGSRR
jgi:hypothetical protein